MSLAPNAKAADTGMPAPRMQFTWRKPCDGEEVNETCPDWICDYHLVLPLGEFDMRAEDDESGELGVYRELHVFMGRSFRGSTSIPCDGDPKDMPYRAGAHAFWDGAALGGLPVYVVAPGGSWSKVDKR